MTGAGAPGQSAGSKRTEKWVIAVSVVGSVAAAAIAAALAVMCSHVHYRRKICQVRLKAVDGRLYVSAPAMQGCRCTSKCSADQHGDVRYCTGTISVLSGALMWASTSSPIQISIFLTFCPVQCLLTPTRCHVDHSTTSACLLLPGPAALFKPSAVPFRTSAVAGSSASWQAQVLQDKGDKDTSHDRDSRMGTSGPVSGHSSLTMGAQASPFVPRSPFEDMRVGLVSASMLRSAPRCLTSSCT